MKKPIGKILVLLVALVLVASLLPAAVLATGESSPCVGWSLTLCDRISANFYFTIADEDVANTKVNFTCDGQTVTVNASETGKKDGNYVFSIGLAAAQMTDTFGVELVTNDQQVFYKEYSVREYANYVLTSGDYTQRDKDMVVAMLNYGAAAQKYFGYNTDALAIAGYEGQVKTYTMPETVDGVGVTGSLDGIELHGRSLLFKSRTAIRFYFEVTGNVADYTFTDGNGKTYTPDKNGDYYSFDVTDINPQNLADIVTITVSKGEESMSVSYSPLQYMVRKKNSTTANLPELVQAMYDYYQAAMKYLFVDGGKVTASNSWAGQTTADNWGGVYFNLAANDAPFTAWGVRYKPTTNDAIQLIRDGVTYDVANTGWETITRASSDTEYYLEGWTLADLKPFQANDVIRINGSFYDAANRVTLTIQDSYLLVLEGGQMYLCAGEPVAVNGGVMSAYSDPSGLQSGGFYFSMTENAAGVDDWGAAGTYYKPVTASAVKLIRNGETSNIGLVTQDMITKFNATSYFYKAENWMLGDKYPLTNGDIVVLEGNFYATVNGTTYILNLGKTYAEVTDSTMLFYTVQGGTLQTHANGGSAIGGYGSLAANTLPYDGWNVEYKPLTADTIKLVRNGVTTSVGNSERGTLVKYDETSYYLKYESGMHESFPLQPHDYLIVDGVFFNSENGQSIRINTTYVYYNGPTVTMSDSAPTLPTIHELGVLDTNANGRVDTQNNETLLYFTADIGSAPTGAEYDPAEKAGLKLVRDGITYDIGRSNSGTIWLDASGNHFVKLASWTVADSSLLPLQNTDHLIVEGVYNARNSTEHAIEITKSYVYYNGSAWVWSDKEPVTEYDIGVLGTNANGKALTANETLLYFSADPKGAPTGGEYYPEEKANLKFVRGETVYEIGVSNSGTIWLDANGNHFVKLASWTMADGLSSLLPLQDTDYLIVEGVFRGNDAVTAGASIKITKSYIYHNGSAWIWSDIEPVTLFNLGAPSTNANGKVLTSNETLLYFSAETNSAPVGEYYPAYAENLKFVRGGVTYNVGTTQGTIALDGDGNHFLKLAGWTVNGVELPLLDTDYLIVEGTYVAFTDSIAGNAIQIPKSYVYYNGSAWVWSDKEPVTEYDIGVLGTNANGKALTTNETLLYFSADPKGAPTGGEYYPEEKANLKFVRGETVYEIGVSNSGTIWLDANGNHFVKLASWTMADGLSSLLPLQDTDYLIVEGVFRGNDAVTAGASIKITKSYIYHNGSAWIWSDIEPVTLFNLGAPSTNANGKVLTTNETLLYFSAETNSAPAGEYYPAYAQNLKFVRGGVTYNVGTTQGTIALEESGNHFLKLASWTVNGVDLPLLDTDYLIVEGTYIAHTDSIDGNAIQIPRSYVYYDGYAWVWSDSEPVDSIATGPLLTHSNGRNDNGLFVDMADNDAPYGEYTPVESSNFQVIRKDGTVTDLGVYDAGTLVKESGYYFLKCFAEMWWTNETVSTEDIMVVSGLWQCKAAGYTDVYLNIAKSYVYFDGSAWVVSQTLPSIVDGGTMTAHDDGVDEYGEIFFSLANNSLPVDDSGDVVYTANAGTVKLSRAGKTYDMSGYVMKLDEGYYYMDLTESGNLPLQDQDYLIVEGNFVNEDNGYTLNIAKSYIFMDGEEFVFTTIEPEIGFMVTNLNISGDPVSQTDGGVEFNVTHDAHGATVNSDWSAEYTPISADAIKLVRGGETFSVGNPGQGTLVALSSTSSYFKFRPWTFTGDKLPLQEGDTVIIDGLFQHAGSGDIMNVEYTEIVVGAGGTLTFPNAKIVYNIGALGSHGAGKAASGFYATAAASSAPYNGDWSLRYKPVSADCVKFYDASEKTTTSVANTGGDLVKYSETEYFFDSNALGDSFEKLALDDYYIIEGRFYNAANNCYIQIERTYASFDGETFVFSTTEPVIPYHVYNLTNHPNGKETTGSGGTGIYINHDAHGATVNSDWSVEYAALSADNIKIVRDGVTTSIAYTGQGTLVAVNETTSYLKLEGWTVNPDYKVLQAGDRLILDGKFQHNGGTDVIDIEYTEILVNSNGTLSFISEEDKYVDGGIAYAHSDGWNNDEVTFFMNKNGLPVDSTSGTRYNPTSTVTIKKIRNGVTTDVGNTGAETIYKNYEERYAIAAWAVGGVQAGDVLIIEGDFVNASNGYTLHIDKSYLTLNADGSVTASRVEDTGNGAIELPIVPADMTIGVWNGSHHGFDDATMDKLVNAGITRIIGIRPQYAGDVNALLDRAQAHGISIILDIRNETTSISFNMNFLGTSKGTKDSEYWNGNSDIDGFDLSTLDLHHPALEGLSVFDEPWVYSTDVEKIQAAKTAFDALDKKEDLIFFVNLLPEDSGDEKFWEQGYSWNYTPDKDYEANYVSTLLNIYGGNTAIAPLSWDNYTLIRETADLTKPGIRTDFFHNFEVMQNKSNPAWFTMLSAGHTPSVDGATYTTPTQGELRWQMAAAMAFGVQNINHYVFATTATDYTCMASIDSNGNITGWNALYDDVAQVGKEYKAWDEIFMAYDYVGTNTVNLSSQMTALENGVDLSSHGISSIDSSSGGVLVGVFENNGDKAYMITNAGSTSSTTVGDGKAFSMGNTTVTLNLTGCSKVAVIDQGEISVLTVTNNSVQIPVGAYEGVFVIPVA